VLVEIIKKNSDPKYLAIFEKWLKWIFLTIGRLFLKEGLDSKKGVLAFFSFFFFVLKKKCLTYL
jgi:hypothetical protein